ncbi:hypothetical protein E8E13_002982 [Curvularia kusanoi]|uniref:Uncharacterized protein n=1 Tax=Curvularia kusanoi TaxID=90978 RepID=A0A9P4T774_CURKU|nr:hypothetical protein E8E13_002982 [Curvularia kusanoi]
MGRGDIDNTCSKCHWFGGQKCYCMLAKDTSYNDQIWSVMIDRGKYHNYTILAAKGRKEVNSKNGVTPEPMPANKIKADWQGETEKVLLSKPDMLLTSGSSFSAVLGEGTSPAWCNG